MAKQFTPPNTSWKKAGKWYNKIVGERGHYFHQHVVIPNTLKLLDLKSNDSLLDIGCGQGVLVTYLPKTLTYYGVDNAANLIDLARSKDKLPNHYYMHTDATGEMPIGKTDFTHAVCMLSLQNISDAGLAIKNIAKHLRTNGTFVIVLNHPCFRIPRQSSWETDPQNKLQYRRINRYLSPLKIPITTHPGRPDSSVTWTFHLPLSEYSKFLFNSGFVIEQIAEWTSDKESEGSVARSENRARSEFPLFLAIKARKE